LFVYLFLLVFAVEVIYSDEEGKRKRPISAIQKYKKVKATKYTIINNSAGMFVLLFLFICFVIFIYLLIYLFICLPIYLFIIYLFS
jgi:hypothetical protein